MEEDLEKSGLDFTPTGTETPKIGRSSSQRIAMFMFMGAGAVFVLVTMAIMGSDQLIRGGQAPKSIVQPSNQASQVIPSFEFRQPDPEPEKQEDLMTSTALQEADKNLPSLQTPVTLPVTQQPVPVRPVVARNNTQRRQSMPIVSEHRREAQTQRMQAAAAPTAVSSFTTNGSAASPMAGVDAMDASLSGSTANSAAANSGMDMSGSSNFSDVTAMSDPNGWSRKDAFSNQPSSAGQEYSKHNVMFKRSNFEIKAGTIIPCVLISGLNSDLPGNAIAQVSENVWDTATGNYLLIPRGSRLIGNYDNQVTYGQNRALVIWSRLIFPDGSSLTLDNLKGADQSGYSGFKGQVNKHWGSLISSALLVSLIGAGVELAEPNNKNNNNNNNNNNRRDVGSILSERVATGIADALTQIIQREIQRQPTIKVKPGYRFMVMAQKDIVFPGSWRR